MTRRKYDWAAIRARYEAGATLRECQAEFGFSNGAWDSAIARGEINPRPPSTGRPPGVTRRAVAALLAEGLNHSRIAARLGIAKPTVTYHVRMLGLPVSSRFAVRYDWAAVQQYYDEGHSLRECQAEFGFARASWSSAVRRGDIVPRPHGMSISELLSSPHRNRGHIKIRLLRSGVKSPECEICGLREWRGRPVPLELHHVNGDGKDNRLDNLQIVCANCHAQTDTWGGRNKRVSVATAG